MNRILILLLTISAGSASAEVSFDRLLNAADEPQSWLTYSGTYRSERFSPLTEINRSNVNNLKVIWAYQMQPSSYGGAGLVETTPLVADGIMYLTEPPSTVTALDARTGKRLWTWSPEMPEEVLHIGFPMVNRGVALLDDAVYVGTLDAHLVALDAATGAVRWDVEVADNKLNYSLTLAPLAIDGQIIIGMSGAEAGIRSFVDAYDSATGERLWRFYTIPAPGEPGSETWQGDDWQTGGGSTWLTGSFDPELDLLYWTVGNPAPDWNGDLRPGDNLYSCSIIALDPQSGEMKWYFQFTPHDVHDWDATQIPILADTEFGGRQRKLMLWQNRNAFFYVLDRETGEFLLGEPFARMTWAEGLDQNGRPIRIPDTFPSVQGTTVSPSIGGGTNWWSPSYSPRTDLLYVNAYDGETTYYIRDQEYVAGQTFTGGGGQTPLPQANYFSAIRAISPQTGERVWEYPIQPRSTAGVLSTAGDVVFSGTVDGFFFALDAETGEELWHINVGSRVHAAPMSYSVDGKQYVGIAAGNVFYTFGLRD